MTEKARLAGRWLSRFKRCRLRVLGKSGLLRPRRDDESDAPGSEVVDAMLPRKASKLQVHMVTVPQTDTGGQVENPKALERTRVKELGKMVP